MRLLAILLIGFMAAPPAKPPVIPDDLKAEFWKAQALLLEAQQTLNDAVQVKVRAVDKLQKFCTGYQVQFDAEKNPTCVATIPVVNKPAEVKK